MQAVKRGHEEGKGVVRMLRAVDVLRTVVGLRAAVDSHATARSLLGRAPTPLETGVVRVLGVRQVTQAVVTAATGRRMLGAGVDLLHGLSMLALLAVAFRRYGRAAGLQSIEAMALAVLELRTRHVRE